MMRFQVMTISIAITWAHQSTSSHPTSNSTRLTHSLHRHSFTVTAQSRQKKSWSHAHKTHKCVKLFFLNPIEVSNNHLVLLVKTFCSENQFLVHILYVRKTSVLLFSVAMEVSES